MGAAQSIQDVYDVVGLVNNYNDIQETVNNTNPDDPIDNKTTLALAGLSTAMTVTDIGGTGEPYAKMKLHQGIIAVATTAAIHNASNENYSDAISNTFTAVSSTLGFMANALGSTLDENKMGGNKVGKSVAEAELAMSVAADLSATLPGLLEEPIANAIEKIENAIKEIKENSNEISQDIKDAISKLLEKSKDLLKNLDDPNAINELAKDLAEANGILDKIPKPTKDYPQPHECTPYDMDGDGIPDSIDRDPFTPYLDPNSEMPQWVKDLADKTYRVEYYDPLALDLNGDGAITTLAEANRAGALFDHDGDGIRTATGWIAPQDGILVRDINGNGIIDNGKELFGNSTVLKNGQLATSGLQALADLDDNADGIINAKDQAFNSLKIWQDKNGDGISTADELISLTAAGITSINVKDKQTVNQTVAGGTIKEQTTFTKADGTTSKVADINFTNDGIHSQYIEKLAVSDAVAKLPDLKGFGRLADLHQAAMKSPELAAALENYSHLTTRAEQKAALDNLLALWAKTDPHYVDNQVEIVNVYTTHWQYDPNSTNVIRLRRGQSLPDYLTLPKPLPKNYADDALENKLKFSESALAFTPSDIYFQRGKNDDNVTPMLNVYENTKEALFQSLLSQTILKPYLDSLKVITDGDRFAAINNLLATNYQKDPVTTLEDLKDLLNLHGTSLDAIGWDKGFVLLQQWREELTHSSDSTIKAAAQAIFTDIDTAKDTGTNNLEFNVITNETSKTYSGLGGDDKIIIGTQSSKIIQAGDGNDIIVSGKGDDYLVGGTGFNTYIFNKNSGHDYVNYDNTGLGFDKLSFVDINYSEATFQRQGDNLVISYGDSSVTIFGALESTSTKPLLFQFADKTIFSASINKDQLTELPPSDNLLLINGWQKDDVLIGNALDNQIFGYEGNDTLTGKKGDDILDGNLGNDTYIFYRGDGKDQVFDSQYNTEHNQLVFKDINALDIGKVFFTGQDLTIQYGDNDQVVLKNYLGNAMNSLLTLTFADGTVWKNDDLMAKAVFEGTENAETINGTIDNHTNIINAYGGNDTINGNQTAKNVIDGGTGDDQIRGGNNADVINGGTGEDFIYGLAGNDIIDGGADHDTLFGGAGDDTIHGGDGNDWLQGDAGADTLIGGMGDDSYDVDAFDTIVELPNQGYDAIFIENDFNLLGTNLEEIHLKGRGNFKAIGDAGDNGLYGNEGNNYLDGKAGSDTMSGGNGDDYYVVDKYDSLITNADGTTTLKRGDRVIEGIITPDGYIVRDSGGNDTIEQWDNNRLYEKDGSGNLVDTGRLQDLQTNVENVILKGQATSANGNELNNKLVGNDLDNTLDGKAGNDTLDGGKGADTLIGGIGNDTYVVDNIDDKIIEKANEGIDTVVSSLDYELKDTNLENLTLTDTALHGTGNELDNVLKGNDEANTLEGKAGNDTLDGGKGADTLIGGTGDDTYVVDNVDDKIIENTNEGIDTVVSSLDYELKDTNLENLTLTDTALHGIGNELDNILKGNGQANTLEGKAGNDTLDGGKGADTLIGGTGDDTYIVDNTNDKITENAMEGTDTAITSVNYTLADNIENLTLVDHAVKGTGNDLDNILTGNQDNNILDGGKGADTLIGGKGDDSYYVDSMADKVSENANEGIDTIFAASDYKIVENIERLQLIGNAIIATGNEQNNTLIGNEFNNTLDGQDGDDILDGGKGADTMIGGTGNDTFYVDDSQDQVVENANEGIDTVNSTIDYTAAANIENVTLQGDAINATGNELNNLIKGNMSNNILDGKAGNDTMMGGYGNDIYYVDSTQDQVIEYAGQGDDTVNASADFNLGSNVENLQLNGEALKGTGNDQANSLIGNDKDNTLDGKAGNDTLDGGQGADTLIGGTGDDTYYVDNLNDTIIENANEGNDRVIASHDYVLGANLENLSLVNQAIRGIGNDLNNTLLGNDLNNTLEGQAGDDTLDGGQGADTLIGGTGNDTYYVDNANDAIVENADEGNDTVISTHDYTLSDTFVENLNLIGNATTGTGNNIDNTITGNELDNVLDGKVGNDTLVGGKGNDSYIVDSLGDKVIENANEGTDTIHASLDYTLADNSNIENLSLTGNATKGTGNNIDNTITGNELDNVLDGKAGNDTLIGGKGNDSYYVDSLTDKVVENANEGIDTINANLDYALTDGSNIENLTLIGTATTGTGNNIDNTITGNELDNVLDGKAGNDTLIGGKGNDSYFVDSLTDQVVENANEGIDTINSVIDLALTDNVENLNLLGKAATGTGNSLGNVITGNELDNTLDGMAGIDTLKGGKGNDTYYVDNKDDIVIEIANEGQDLVVASDSYQLIDNVENLTLVSTAISGTGNNIDNTITGNELDNILDGKAGSDNLIGGKGNDTYYVDNYGDTVLELNNEGKDSVIASVDYTLSQNVENLALVDKAVIGRGNSLDNHITGNDLDNVLDGGVGADTMKGGKGNDVYHVDSVNDKIIENASEGIDSVIATMDYTLSSNLENLTLLGTALIGTGNELDNVLKGNELGNTLIGNAGNDILIATRGADILDGGIGKDIYDFDTASLNDGFTKTIKDSDLSGNIRINGQYLGGIGQSWQLTSYNIATDEYTWTDGQDHFIHKDSQGYTITSSDFSSSILIATDSQVDNILGLQLALPTQLPNVIEAKNNLSLGTLGNDIITINDDKAHTINTFAGDDVLKGGSKDDILNGEIGNDTIFGNLGNDKLYGGLGNDILNGGRGNDYLEGSYGNDIYVFNAGDGKDIIKDVSGSDSLDLSGFTLEDLIVTKTGGDLQIKFKSDATSQDSITIQNWDNSAYQIEKIVLSDTTLNNVQLTSIIG